MSETIMNGFGFVAVSLKPGTDIYKRLYISFIYEILQGILLFLFMK
jgi:hypothetical protein